MEKTEEVHSPDGAGRHRYLHPRFGLGLVTSLTQLQKDILLALWTLATLALVVYDLFFLY